MSGEFLDGQIKAYRDKYKDKKLKSPSSIYFSTASIPPDTMNKIRHGGWFGFSFMTLMTLPPGRVDGMLATRARV